MTDRHTHQWTATPTGYTCAHCDETSATCGTCNGPTGTNLLICPACLRNERHVLTGIQEAINHRRWAPPSPLAATRYDRNLVNGGDHDTDPLPEPGGATDLHWVHDVLWAWVAMWTDASGDPQNVAALDYLAGHLLWAAHNPGPSAWDDYRREIRQLRHRARRAAGLLPQHQDTPCVHCGGTVVRDWTDQHWHPNYDGLSDTVRCTGCNMTWNDHGHWRYATRHHLQALPDVQPDALITLADARLVFPHIPDGTIRSWMSRDADTEEPIAPRRGWDVRGVPVYRVGDLATLAERRADTARRGRRATG